MEKIVGDFFASGMDETAINAAGIPPLRPELDRLKAIKTPAEVLTALARLQPFGVGVAFRCGRSPDPKPSEPQRAVRGQGGLGLLERGHDFNDDEKSLKIRQVGRLEAPLVDARTGDPVAAGRVADRAIAGRPWSSAGGGRCGAGWRRVRRAVGARWRAGRGNGAAPRRPARAGRGGAAQRCGW